VVAYPWRRSDKADLIAHAALRLTDQGSERLFDRAVRRIKEADGLPPAWITDMQRAARNKRLRLISISGTNGKSTTTRMITHIARVAGRRVGTTTTDGVLIDEQMVEPGDFSGPQGARAVMRHSDVEIGVLETARGGILLRGLAYESNEASVLTNISADHLDLQGLHTLPELAEVKSVICRVTRPSGAVVLNADDPLLVPVARRVRAPVTFFSLRPNGARIRSHLKRGGTAFVLEDGWIVERVGVGKRRRIVAVDQIPPTLGGLARHNVANALAAAAGARALGLSYQGDCRGVARLPELGRPDARSPEHLPQRRSAGGHRLRS
jgi:cyanophycin synthetase